MDHYQSEIKSGEPVLVFGEPTHMCEFGAFVAPVPYSGPIKDHWNTDYTTDSVINFGTKDQPKHEVVPDCRWLRVDPRSSEYAVFKTKYDCIRFQMHQEVSIVHGCYAGRIGFINGIDEKGGSITYTVRLYDEEEPETFKPQIEVKLPGWCLTARARENTCTETQIHGGLDLPSDMMDKAVDRLMGALANVFTDMADKLRESVKVEE